MVRCRIRDAGFKIQDAVYKNSSRVLSSDPAELSEGLSDDVPIKTI